MFRSLMLVVALVTVEAVAQSTGPLTVEDRMSGRTPAREKVPDAVVATDDATGTYLLFQEIQQLEARLQQMQGEIEELRHELETAKASERARYIDLDSRISLLARSMEENAGDRKEGPAATRDGGSPDTANPRVDAQADRDAYKAARELLMQGEQDAARAAFQGYLENFPDGQFRPFAHFWLGDLFRQQGPAGREQAMQAFRKVIEEYPSHSQVSPALYKLATLQAESGNLAAARVTLNRIILQYPGSSEARLAQSMLDQLD